MPVFAAKSVFINMENQIISRPWSNLPRVPHTCAIFSDLLKEK